MILFSDYFNKKLTGNEEWHDPLVGYDTKLFIDPFLVDKLGGTIPEFENAHDKVINFFNSAFIDAASIVTRSPITIKPLIRSLTFPEVDELCLGYSEERGHGAGSGKKFAEILLTAMFSLIDHGVTEISKFEEIELFDKGFGADRLGDMMANLLKPELVKYTQRMCKSHDIELKSVRLRNFEHVRGRVWDSTNVMLPCIDKPSMEKRFVILTPKKFLRDLPTIDIDDFWTYSYHHENDAIRSQFGQDIKENVDKDTMFEAAKTAELRRKYLESLENKQAIPYDVDIDPDLKKKWFPLGEEVAQKFPLKLSPPSNDKDFIETIRGIVGNFKHYIEENRGWLLIRTGNPGKGRKEEVVQRLFDGITYHYCKANDIDVSPEVNTGRGPVDFKFSTGYTNRALIEVKLARNQKWLDGLKVQLPIYLKSGRISHGFFVIIVYEERDIEKLDTLRNEIPKLEIELSIKLDLIAVDARPKESASKAKKV